MLSLNYIRDNKELIVKGLSTRNYPADTHQLIPQIIELDDERKHTQKLLDDTRANINNLSKEIGDLFKKGEKDRATELRAQVGQYKEQSQQLAEKAQQIGDQLKEMLYAIPNVPHPSVPAGNTDQDNELFKDWNQPLPDLGDSAAPHWELAKKYHLIDFELGVKITGAGFPLFRGKGARFQRGLINFFLDEARQAGYEEIMPPLLVNEATATATGQLPDKEGQMYHTEKDDLYLIPTAEVPITNMYRNVIVDHHQLPVKLTGHTPCFRREAGAYGKDVRGLNRVHQFEKVEIVVIEHPDRSYDTLMDMLQHVEGLLQKLELPYRILRLCGGDLGFTSALTFDFEVWSAAQKRWLEVSSVSNFETFQSNRMKLRFKDANGQNHLAHTLNGSALALARIVAALLENNQTPEGIRIPAVLEPYTGFATI